jgi:predicted CoA-binding protein
MTSTQQPHTAIVLGASAKPERYSNMAVARFLAAGWNTIPVHPAGGNLYDQPVRKHLSECPPQPTVVSVYLGPKYFPAEIPAIADLKPDWVWLNPGADDAATAAGLRIAQVCSLVMLGHPDPLTVLSEQQP